MKHLTLIIVAACLCAGCATQKITMVNPATGETAEISENRFLMRTSGKSNSAMRETDGSWLVEFKSDEEGGDTELIQAISAGVAAGLAAAAAP